MTPTEQAARWLADVPRHADSQGYEPEYILETDALAAIARHLAPGDDLKLIADCELAAKVMTDAGTFETGQNILREAAARISALTATVAEAKADAEFLTKNRNEWQDACTVARNEAATLRDRLARMEGAATKIRGLIKYDLNPKSCEITASEDGEFVVYDHVSAALTDGGKHE